MNNRELHVAVNTRSYDDEEVKCCGKAPRETLTVSEALEVLENQQEGILSSMIEINYRLKGIEPPKEGDIPPVGHTYEQRLSRLTEINGIILRGLDAFRNDF